ncbi:MAG: hypothetical protein COB81_08840 [Flavobacteriaceae bacterium]|nr:MAG: hypothetical protein COB81_08840 [Flavobacteriaceae bacterium]
MLSAVIAVVGGIVACVSFVNRKKKYTKKRLTQFMMFQCFIGVMLSVVGIYGVIQSFLTIEILDFYWGLQLGLNAMQIIVSFLLIYSLFSIYYLEKNKNDKDIGKQLRTVLGKYQFYFGIMLVSLGLVITVL